MIGKITEGLSRSEIVQEYPCPVLAEFNDGTFISPEGATVVEVREFDGRSAGVGYQPNRSCTYHVIDKDGRRADLNMTAPAMSQRWSTADKLQLVAIRCIGNHTSGWEQLWW